MERKPLIKRPDGSGPRASQRRQQEFRRLQRQLQHEPDAELWLFGDDRKYRCEVCGFASTNKRGLQLHMGSLKCSSRAAAELQQVQQCNSSGPELGLETTFADERRRLQS